MCWPPPIPPSAPAIWLPMLPMSASEARGRSVADALIGAVAAEGRSRGWTVIRWITAEDNARARGVYDRMAVQTKWVTYDLKV